MRRIMWAYLLRRVSTKPMGHLIVLGTILWLSNGCPKGRTPDPFFVAGVRANRIDLSAVHSQTYEGLGNIRDIEYGDFDPSPGMELAIAGLSGGVVLDENFAPLSSVRFRGESLRSRQIVDVDSDRRPEYLSLDFRRDLILEDSSGNVLWSKHTGWSASPRDGTTLSRIHGDLDGDGSMEFAILTVDADGPDDVEPGQDGIAVLDRMGETVWALEDFDANAIAITDPDKDGILNVVTFHAFPNRLTIFGAEGQITDTIVFDEAIVHRCSGFAFLWAGFLDCSDPVRTGLLVIESKVAKLVDLEGGVCVDFEWPIYHETLSGSMEQLMSGSIRRPRGISVRLSPTEDPFYAIVGNFRKPGGLFSSAPEQGELLVFDASGAVVYDEIVDGGALAIAVIPGARENTQRLIVGTEDAIAVYEIVP